MTEPRLPDTHDEIDPCETVWLLNEAVKQSILLINPDEVLDLTRTSMKFGTRVATVARTCSVIAGFTMAIYAQGYEFALRKRP